MGNAAPLGLRRAVALADFTTWKVGGPAQWFAEPDTPEQLAQLLAWGQAEGLPCRVIGAGSNLLVSDDGLVGLTLCNRRLQGAELERSSGLIEARGLQIDLDEVFDSSAYTAHAAAIVARLDDVVG